MQSQMKWNFSNKKPADLEFMLTLMGGQPSAMMDESEASFVQCQSMSSGRLGVSGQLSLPQSVKATLQIEMMGEDPGMQFAAFML